MSWEFDRVSMAETLEIPTGGFISDWDKVYPQSCLMCSITTPNHHSVTRVPALRYCSCQIDAKANENIGLI